MLQYLKGNKFLLIFFGSFIIHNTFKVTFNNYIAEHLLGDLAKNTIIGAVSIPFVFLVYFSLPFLMKRNDKFKMYQISIMGSVIVSTIQFFVGYKNFGAFLAISALRGFVEGFAGALMFTFSADTVEYGHYRTGIRKEGITFSIQTFSVKLTAAIAGVITSLVLVFIGYSADVTVTASMKSWIWAASCFLPAIGALISLPVLMKYNLKDGDVQIMADINSGLISREEGEKKLSKNIIKEQ